MQRLNICKRGGMVILRQGAYWFFRDIELLIFGYHTLASIDLISDKHSNFSEGSSEPENDSKFKCEGGSPTRFLTRITVGWKHFAE